MFRKNSLLFCAFTCEKIIVSKNDALPTATTRCAFYPTADITLYYKKTLKYFYKKRTLSVSPTNKWTVYLFFSSIGSVTTLFGRNGQRFGNVQKEVYFKEKTEEGTAVRKKFFRKEYKEHFSSFFQKAKSTQTSWWYLQKHEQVQKSAFELQPIKTVDCFLEDYVKSTSVLLTLKTKCSKFFCFLRPIVICTILMLQNQIPL